VALLALQRWLSIIAMPLGALCEKQTPCVSSKAILPGVRYYCRCGTMGYDIIGIADPELG